MAGLLITELGFVAYENAHQRMLAFTEQRQPDWPDEIWLLQHPPVFTQGLAGRAEHLLDAGDIPVVQTERGGQITYHGPGQLIAYCMIDLRRRRCGVHWLVNTLEQVLIETLNEIGIAAERHTGAPGVYVGAAKIASLGLRIRRGCSFHGLALNVDMDLSPFRGINPCGHAGLVMTQVCEWAAQETLETMTTRLHSRLLVHFGQDCCDCT